MPLGEVALVSVRMSPTSASSAGDYAANSSAALMRTTTAVARWMPKGDGFRSAVA
jgi:hypothetical protein